MLRLKVTAPVESVGDVYHAVSGCKRLSEEFTADGSIVLRVAVELGQVGCNMLVPHGSAAEHAGMLTYHTLPETTMNKMKQGFWPRLDFSCEKGRIPHYLQHNNKLPNHHVIFPYQPVICVFVFF